MKFPLDVRCALSAWPWSVRARSSPDCCRVSRGLPRDIHTALQSAGTGHCLAGRRRTLNAIVTVEVALALTLLLGAALLLRAYWQVQSIDPGCRRAGVLTYNSLCHRSLSRGE